MYILAKLVFLNYFPEEIEEETLWKCFDGEVYQLKYTKLPLEHLLEKHGYPVKPYIMPISANPDDKVEPLVYPDQIGWWDEGPKSDELRDVTIKDFNDVLELYDGILHLEVNVDTSPDGTEFITPELYMDKVTIGIAVDEKLEEDYEDDTDEDDLTDYDNEWFGDDDAGYRD